MGIPHLLVALVFLTIGECVQQEWTANVYPDPTTDWTSCGRRSKSFVCDPNRIISKEKADYLDHILLNFPKDTRCPCSAWSCERNNTGYLVGVALVNKMARPENFEDTEEGRTILVRRFAFDLLKKKWRWGTCEEVTIIVFSKEDGILLTLPGSTPRERLTEPAINAIQRELVRFFKKDEKIGQGLGFLVLNYRHVLDGHHYYPIIYSHVESGAGIVQLSILTSLLTTILLKIFC